ncbi:MAG: adenylate/guanylate cyclase domain-containing protein [Ignavibacteriae bacterium]|nr:adenylate/guanylate cyclase domain-containing protein [Ignavibacteriota bacterium]
MKNEQRWEEAYRYISKYHEIKDEVQSDEVIKQTQRSDLEKGYAVERARSQATDEILANILPPNITERLLQGEKKIADTHENVSVLFADIVGFTLLSAKLSAGELIDVLDIVFSRFDTICKKHGLEKIKTIGDAYMAVCGAPISYENHAERTSLAALEMLEYFEIEQGFSIPIQLSFRIGLHSGNVVAGIIGENKYAYDLWGDAVNTASRMESHGEPGKIHVSEDFVKVAGKYGNSIIKFNPRGEMDIKGKGMMKTYFLEKIQ